MGSAMFDTARALARANLRVHCPSDAALRFRLFVRTYGGDFDPDTLERIAEWFSTPHRVMGTHDTSSA